ncbi:Multidrug resistance-associated protein 1 [Mortierella alpina]|uniref:Multidrug resistance-associated protein 1 n=1 Tax=Mortierella alpina TaxID=64518 RepID=A0A9P6M235_MORAP|nr:Multidrug resistance-associated protein 1 [Mortierella alpina]
MALAGGSALFNLQQRLWMGDGTTASNFGHLSFGLAWLTAIVLCHNEHKYSIRSSDHVLSFYMASILASLLVLRTMASLDQKEGSQFPITIFTTACLLLGFLVEAWPRTNTYIQQHSGASAYEKANLLSRCTFQFFQPIILLSAKRTIVVDDIQNQLPEYMSTHRAQERLDSQWQRNVIQCKRQGKTPSLFRTILQVNAWAMIPILFFRIVRPLLLFSIPGLLSLFLEYLQNARNNVPENDTSVAYGLLIAGSMFAAALLGAVIQAVSRQYSSSLSLQTKVALTTMVYRKALRLSPDSKKKSTTGEIINHMSVDADVWTKALYYMSMWVSLPVEICLAMWLLYRLLGWSFLAGIAALIIMSPLQVYRARVYNRMQKDKLSVMDERIRLTAEVLSAIKVVKLYGWEASFKQRILAIRDRELEALRKLGVIFAVMSIIFTSSTLIISLLTLSVYATWGGEDFTPGKLTPQTVFVSMTLFSMLRYPIGMLAEATSNTLATIVGTKRVEGFLLLEEVQESGFIRERGVPDDPSAPLVTVQNATFFWTNADSFTPVTTSEEDDETQPLLSGRSEGREGPLLSCQAKPTLKDITLSFNNKSLTAVLGRIGQGKSSLLSAIIGEMYKTQGYVRTHGRIAYVPQHAWILNTTLRENILFGSAYDADRYQQILFAAGLGPDLAMLPDGDLSEIGERGINLSGGQKQRISLARAAYQDADIYLLDDPLSAVDAHVDRHLWMHMVGPKGLLKDKTRILVTHGIHHLKEVDAVVVIKDGQVAELGGYTELMSAKKTFYHLIKEYTVKERAQQGVDHSAATAAKFGGSSQTFDKETATHIPGASLPVLESGSDDGQSSNSTVNLPEEAETSRLETLKDPVAIDAAPTEATKVKRRGELVPEEKIKEGSIGFKTALIYIRALSYKYAAIVILFHVLAEVSLVGTNLWLKHWISLTDDSAGDDAPPPSLKLFLSVFTLLTVAFVLLCICTIYTGFAVARIRASRIMHKDLLSKIFRVPPSFFDTTPLGRILNRFSSDLQGIDDKLPWCTDSMVFYPVSLSASLIVVSVTTPIFLIALPAFAVTALIIQHYYLQASRALKRIFHVSKSPIFQHFNETLGGVSTIRAMHLQSRFTAENDAKIDSHINTHLAYLYSVRWMEVRLHSLSAVVTFLTAAAFVWNRKTTDPALAGLAMSFALKITSEVSLLVQAYCEMQNQLVSVERVDEYTELETEAPERLPSSSITRQNWPPKHGSIVFDNYSTRYREGLDLVLRNVSFQVQAGEKVGIVGRTGAGKSSLTLALFRMIEAANSQWTTKLFDRMTVGAHQAIDGAGEDGGKIEIDGIDISTIGLVDLRHALAIIPQDPVLFAGSVRDNLDPFGEHPDHDLWEALERAHLKDYISSLAGGLAFEVSHGGDNFSVGQRSLICLARALLRKTKILVLDEATSAVDMETDKLIQRTIRGPGFEGRTVLTIAHRIKTVMDFDKILVLDKGEVVEFDTPDALLRKGEASLFFTLAQQAGEV